MSLSRILNQGQGLRLALHKKSTLGSIGTESRG
jgi:hypothetical protein